MPSATVQAASDRHVVKVRTMSVVAILAGPRLAAAERGEPIVSDGEGTA
jgi:hypothetical protein